MARPWISVVVPAYNEERGIADTVVALRDWLAARDDRPFEVIVVDNASTDGTAGQVEPLAADERVKLLRNEHNRGKGYSVRRGMLNARGALRLHCDADCAPSLASLPGMLALIEDADVVIGSRLAEGAQVGQRQPLTRRIVGRSFVLLCRAVLSEPTTDLYCGFKLWREDAAEDVFTRIHLDGWTFDAEALAMARALGYRLRETGIVWSDREGSRLSMARVLVPVVRELVSARRHIRREAQRPRATLTEAPAAESPR